MSKSAWQAKQDPKPRPAYVQVCYEMAHCPACGQRVAMGEQAVWHDRHAWHLACGKQFLPEQQLGLFGEVTP
jgi:hypothetical protein